jgi:hypothetical protein
MSDSPTSHRRCPNGHRIGVGNQFCTECGSAAAPDDVTSCSNGHPMAQGEKFCGLCGLPRVDDVVEDSVSHVGPSGKNGTNGSREPLPASQGSLDPSRMGRGIWTLGVVLIVALAAVAITALVVHSGSHNALPKTANIPSATNPATSAPTGTGGVPRFVDCVIFSTPPQPKTYPTQIITNCGGSSQAPVSNLSWSTWTTTSAAGTGVYVVNSCNPSCSAGNYNRYPASIVLSFPGSTTWGTLFTQAQITYVDQSGQSQSVHVTYPQLVTR